MSYSEYVMSHLVQYRYLVGWKIGICFSVYRFISQQHNNFSITSQTIGTNLFKYRIQNTKYSYNSTGIPVYIPVYEVLILLIILSFSNSTLTLASDSLRYYKSSINIAIVLILYWYGTFDGILQTPLFVTFLLQYRT